MKTALLSFLRIVKAEIAKLKGTFAFWLAFLYPLGTVMLVTVFWIGMNNRKNFNTDTLINNLGNTASFFLPFFLVLIIGFACFTDHKNSMLKHILALPVPRHIYFFGKLTGIMVYIGLAFILTFIFAYFSIFLCGLVNPKLGFGDSFNHLLLFRLLLRAYLASTVIYTFQFWMGMRLRNLTLPLAIGSALIILPIAILIIMGITGLINDNGTFVSIITYNPYSNAFSGAFSMMKPGGISCFSTPTYIFLSLSVVTLVLGAWEFNRRNI